MPTLHNAQNNFIATINQGPDALDPELFAGPEDRILLGLQAHANTISHSRLIALEECFPRTRGVLGEQWFNQICREYCEQPEARCADNNAIGSGLPAYLAAISVDPSTIDLARIEWAWLQSYHAPEANALSLANFAAMQSKDLLILSITWHPATRQVALTAPLSTGLAEIAAIDPDPAAVLLVRPEAEVRLLPLDGLKMQLINAAAQKNAIVGNLLNIALEHTDDDAPLAPIMELIGAGALVSIG